LLRGGPLGQRVQCHAVRRVGQRAGGAAARRAGPIRAIPRGWRPASGRG
jgi:hypothetical protein